MVYLKPFRRWTTLSKDCPTPKGLKVNHLYKVSNDGKLGVVSEGDDLLVDHKSKDTQHGGTAVVELDGTLGELGLLIKVIPSEVDVSVTEVTNVLVSGSL